MFMRLLAFCGVILLATSVVAAQCLVAQEPQKEKQPAKAPTRKVGVLANEAGAFPGAENWSGCVFFAESLTDPDLLGPEGVEALAWERRLVERGLFSGNGHSFAGVTYRDPAAFRHCYTVLRPIFDHHLAQVARQAGATILTDTTVEGLIRERGRVIGVSTQRGPIYADLVFLAEGR